MTIQDWAAIAVAISTPITAIATLFAPTLAEIVKFRINQPKPAPDANQPKKRSRRKGGLLLKPRVLVLLILCVGEVVMLVNSVRSTAPIDGASVLAIAFLVSSLLFTVLGCTLLYSIRFTASMFRSQWQIQQGTLEQIDDLIDWTTQIYKALVLWFYGEPAKAKETLDAINLPKST